ncbi:hypothetical protein V1478_002731 [Vespula squamosa]|uniref:Uncharacterized protein n=1 Tax=Vespula squamosa TaxID=30214 RepID=A0ABD2BSG7_VESSQ
MGSKNEWDYSIRNESLPTLFLVWRGASVAAVVALRRIKRAASFYARYDLGACAASKRSSVRKKVNSNNIESCQYPYKRIVWIKKRMTEMWLLPQISCRITPDSTFLASDPSLSDAGSSLSNMARIIHFVFTKLLQRGSVTSYHIYLGIGGIMNSYDLELKSRLKLDIYVDALRVN